MPIATKAKRGSWYGYDEVMPYLRDECAPHLFAAVAANLPVPHEERTPRPSHQSMTRRCHLWGGDRIKTRAAAGFILAACTSQALAQSASPMSSTELAKESQNPLTLVTTLPLRYEPEFNDTADNETKASYLIDQAVLPFKLNDNWVLITRTKLPVISQPPKKSDGALHTGLGNGYTTFFLSPAKGEDFYWGVGPVLYYPASSSAVGIDRWGSGPSIGFVKKDESPWEFGAVVNNIWSVGAPPHGSNATNKLLLNPFVSYHFGDGWALSSSPSITANWVSKPGQQWTVPVGGGVSKTFRFGSQPVKLAFDAYDNVIRPEAHREQVLLQFTVTFLFPD
jgi:hypothetical protein